MKGRVKWWSKEEGYGFIEYSDDSNIFAYLEDKQKNKLLIEENEEIEFELENTSKGLLLKNLKKIENYSN